MRSLLFLAPLALAACASSGPAAPVVSPGRAVPPSVASAAVVVPSDPVSALARSGLPDSITTRQAAAMLGAPDVDRRDGVGALMTWRLPTCALVLGFANDRLSHVDIAARTPNQPPPSSAQCVAEARARRTSP